MIHLDVTSVTYTLPDGRPLLRDVSLSLGSGERVAIIGANGAGKSTLLRIVTGELSPGLGNVTCTGSLGVARQFITGTTVRELLLSVAPPAIRDAATQLAHSEATMNQEGTTQSQMAYASAVASWGEVGGYGVEVLWDVCTVAALGICLLYTS